MEVERQPTGRVIKLDRRLSPSRAKASRERAAGGSRRTTGRVLWGSIRGRGGRIGAPMFDSDHEDKVFRRRLMKEVAPGVPVNFSFYSPSVKVQVMYPAEHMPGANGRYVGNGVTIEFVP